MCSSTFGYGKEKEYAPGIQLKKEYLSIALLPGPSMRVTVDFHFSGSLSGMELAFPEDFRTKYKNFRAFMVMPSGVVDIPVVREEAPADHLFDFLAAQYPALYRFIVPAGTSSMHHRVTYDADLPFYFRYGHKGEAPSGYAVHYILITGSTWKGSVDILKVEVDPGPFRCKDLVPAERSIDGSCGADGIWRHETKNTELTKDLELVLMARTR